MKKSFRAKPATQGDIDTVVAVVTKGFEEMNNKLGGKIDSLDAKVDRLDKKVESLDKRVGSLETKVEDLDVKVSDIHRRVKDLEGGTAGLRQVVDHEHRIKKLETHVFAAAA